jgi:hypothetical protein
MVPQDGFYVQKSDLTPRSGATAELSFPLVIAFGTVTWGSLLAPELSA